MIKRIVLFICLVGLVVSKDKNPDRKVEISVNPECPSNLCDLPDEHGSFVNLVYAKSTSADDAIHLLYSTIQSFTIMLAKTSPNAKLNISWENLLSNNKSLVYDSIKFSEKPTEIAGYSIPVVYDFYDYKGDASMNKIPNNSSYWVNYETSNLIWSKFNQSKDFIGTFEGRSNHKNGTFEFVIKYDGKTNKRDKELPHLLLNDLSTLIEFSTSVNASFEKSKIGATIVMFTQYDQADLSSKRTLDDEYTPGTFKLWTAKVSDKKTNDVHNFLQWKPIFYYENPKSLESSTVTKQYDIKLVDNTYDGISAAFFESPNTYAMNVSFGLEGNEKGSYFHTKYNYTSWAFSAGLGAAPNEKMSFIVSLVIFIGFGLPALVVVVGLVVLIIKKIKNSRRSEFEEL